MNADGKPETVQELAAATAAVLRERGRCQKSYADDLTGRVCIVGAERVAFGLSPHHPIHDGAWALHCDLSNEIWRRTGESTAAWNDETDDDAVVLRVLDEIAVSA